MKRDSQGSGGSTVSGRTQLPGGLVTFMFTDIEGSTRLARMLGSDYQAVLGAHRAVLRRALSDQDGTELFTEGDSFFVAFSNASSALAACVQAQQGLATHTWPSPETRPQVRMGLHTGYASPVHGEYASAEVHRAARVAAAAHGGQVLCSAATARHAQLLPPDADLLDLGLHVLRGFDDRERLFQVVAPGLERQFPRPRTPVAVTHNLPAPLTSFVGRHAEVRSVAALVRRHRLVTVVGTGGAGKTRLAIQAAGSLLDAYPDGVWFVDLATVADPAALPAAVAAALGLRPEPGRPVMDTLVEYVVRRRLLLVLDTCDAQPRAAVDVVTRLLMGGGDVRVLATSRERLGGHGELVWLIPPLSDHPDEAGAHDAVPAVVGPDVTGSSHAQTYPGDAVALLLERAAAARGGRPCTPDEAGDLLRVARRLEGLPLAIELAAARLRLLSPGQLADRLDDILGVLDPVRDHSRQHVPATASIGGGTARHVSLHATVGWSYRTLGPKAARLLRRLAVFAGPVDLATLEWFGEGDPLGPLSALVDKSMVQVEQHRDGPRYRLAGPVRAYAARRLADGGEEPAARDRHVAWSLHALQGTRLDIDGRPRTLSVRALDRIAAEMLAALQWSATGGGARHGLQLACGLDPWWQEKGRSAVARQWMQRLVGRIAETGERIEPAELASAHLVHAGHAGDLDERFQLLERAEVEARRADDPELVVRVLSERCTPLMEAGRLAEAERAARDVIERAARIGVPGAALAAVIALAELLWRRGLLDEAADLLGGARPVEAARPQDRGRRTVDMILGMVALRRGDLVAAHDHLVVALRSRMRHGFLGPAGDTVNAMAVRCAIGGDPETAAVLFGAAEANRTSGSGARRPGMFGGFWATQQAALRAAIGDAAFDAGYAGGARLSLDKAAAIALTVEHPDLAADSARFGTQARTLR
jgi:predicted ATPase/class 3 adenylate cyclase